MIKRKIIGDSIVNIDEVFSNTPINEGCKGKRSRKKKVEVFSNTKVNEMNIGGIGKAFTGAAKSAFNSTKTVANNVGNTAKTVGGAIKKHPVRTAAIAGTAGAGYLGYKGAKKVAGGASKVGKAAYNDWKA